MTRPPMNKRGFTVKTSFEIILALCLLCFGQSALGATTLEQQCWEKTFDESFDTLSLWPRTDLSSDETVSWRTRYIWDRDVIINNESQYYVDPREHGLEPFFINDGVLTIRADHMPSSRRTAFKDRRYYSGVLTTEKSWSQQYGRFEARLKLPVGRGLWPAFWMLPSFERWPEGIAILPEIDVMEYLGHEQKTYHTTVHTNQTGKLTSHPYHHNRTDLSADFHLYSVVWDAKRITWYFDGEPVASHTTPSDLHQPMHFLLNLAVGGNWPGEPDDKTVFPADYLIDYVRAWEAC